MQLKDIQLVKTLGSGGYGEVHEAVVTGLHGNVAVKRLIKDNNESIERFKREVEILSRLNHENVIPILKYQLEMPPFWFAMPLADSSLLDELPYLVGKTDKLADYFRQILCGMSYAHSQNVIHRDMKPQNILIIDGRIYISDFGLGKRIENSDLHESFTASGVGGGTIVYAAPEQFENFRHATERADIYSLGKILYQMLTNQDPYPTMKIANVPKQFRYIVNKCVQDDPQSRFSSVEELQNSFNTVADSSSFDQLDYSESKLDILFGETFTIETADAICRHFVENLENEEIFRRDFPKLSTQYLSHFVNESLAEFKSILQAFDRHVSGQLDFSYCDQVSDIYLRILKVTDDLDIFRLVATKLLTMGAIHNRFRVMNDFCDLLSNINTEERSKAMMAAEVIKAQPLEFAVVDHNKSARLDNTSLPRIIRETIDQVRGHL